MHNIYCPVKHWSKWLLYAILFLSLRSNAHSSQDSGRITLHVTNQPIEKVFRQIENQTGYAFFYGYKILDPNSLVSINADRSKLSVVMETLLKGKNITWEIKSNGIVLSKKLDTIEKSKSEQFLNDTIPLRVISGSVQDRDGYPIPGASVYVKGSDQGVIADANGIYSLRNVPAKAIIVVTAIGFQMQELPLGNKSDLSFWLASAIGQLDESVIIGYGRTSRRFNTGNVSRVTAEEIGKQPVSNPLQTLQGRVPGMIITQATGTPGGRINVQIRGQNSLRSIRNSTIDGNLPLYIIDGVPFTSTPMGGLFSNLSIIGGSPLNNINPSDIESIEILKDADATSIYGSRGANGVVLITTKKGKAGKTSFDVNAYKGIGKVNQRMKLLNRRQYLDMRYEALRNDGVTLTPSTLRANDLTKWDTTRSTDWQELLIGGTSQISDVNTSISGGSDNTQFLVRGGYHCETTVYPGDFSDKRASLLFNMSHVSSNKKFRANFSINYAIDNNNLKYEDLTASALTLAPVAPSLYDSLGRLNWQNGTWTNPIATLQRTYKAITDNLIGNSVLSYQLVPFVQLKVNLGYTKINMNESSRSPISSFNPATVTQGTATFGTNLVRTWIIEPQAELQKNLFNGKLNILFGSTFQENTNDISLLRGTGYTNDALLGNISAASAIQIQNASNAVYRYNSIFGRINYIYSDRYILNLTGRRDGSSRFGPKKQFANFGSVGAAWLFSSEAFFQENIQFLTFGKLRGSFGTTGNDQIGDYGYLDAYLPTTYTYLGRSGLTPDQTRLFNPDYAWETSKKLEFGLEIGLLNDRFFLSSSWYRNRSSNQLVGYPVSLVTGTSSIQANLPATVQNAGWEFELKLDAVKNNNFSWIASVNLTIPRNKLLSYPNIESSSYFGSYVVGKPLSIWNRFNVTGVDPSIGIYSFEDVNKNGTTILDAPGDYLPLTNIGQDYYGGFSNRISYKGLELDFLFQFAKQTGFNYLDGGFIQPGGLSNQPTLVLDRWQKPGDISQFQKYTQQNFSDAWSAFNYNFTQSNGQIENASYIRLKNVSLSYQLPAKWIRKVHLTNTRIYLQGQNLFTITSYNGLDPETQSTRNLPPLMVVTAGIQLTL